MRWLCVNHVFALEPLDGRSDHLITHPTLVSDVPLRRANGPARDVYRVALHVMRGVFPSGVVQQPHPHRQAFRLALEQVVFGDAARDKVEPAHLRPPVRKCSILNFWQESPYSCSKGMCVTSFTGTFALEVAGCSTTLRPRSFIGAFCSVFKCFLLTPPSSQFDPA